MNIKGLCAFANTPDVLENTRRIVMMLSLTDWRVQTQAEPDDFSE
jgi:hypothetical protein